MTTKLPAVVTRVGGALEAVVSNAEAYTHPDHPLTRRGQVALGRIIESHPGFNTEERLALLVDILAFHGVYQYAEFTSIVDDCGIEVVYLALDYLYEVGDRSRGEGESRESSNDMKYVRNVAELIVRLQQAGFNVSSVELLDDLIHELGGLERAFEVSSEDMENVKSIDEDTEDSD